MNNPVEVVDLLDQARDNLTMWIVAQELGEDEAVWVAQLYTQLIAAGPHMLADAVVQLLAEEGEHEVRADRILSEFRSVTS